MRPGKKVTLVSRRAMIPKSDCWQLLIGCGLLNFQPLYTLGDVLWYLQWQGLRGQKVLNPIRQNLNAVSGCLYNMLKKVV